MSIENYSHGAHKVSGAAVAGADVPSSFMRAIGVQFGEFERPGVLRAILLEPVVEGAIYAQRADGADGVVTATWIASFVIEFRVLDGASAEVPGSFWFEVYEQAGFSGYAAVPMFSK